MTDGHTPEEGHASTSGLPEDEARVRHLLAAAAAPAPAMPADVTVRLEETLRALAAERAQSPGPAGQEPVSLAERRTARGWPRLLVAAAAFSVLGLGVAQVVLDQGQLGQGDSMTSAESGGASGDAADEAPAAQGEDTGARDEDDRTARKESGGVTDLAQPPELAVDSLTVDVQRVADFLVDGADSPEQLAGDGCAQPITHPGDRLVQVRLDGEPAVLVLRSPVDDTMEADVFLCSDPGTAAASTSVQAR